MQICSFVMLLAESNQLELRRFVLILKGLIIAFSVSNDVEFYPLPKFSFGAAPQVRALQSPPEARRYDPNSIANDLSQGC